MLCYVDPVTVNHGVLCGASGSEALRAMLSK
jgi:hypothetical protein